MRATCARAVEPLRFLMGAPILMRPSTVLFQSTSFHIFMQTTHGKGGGKGGGGGKGYGGDYGGGGGFTGGGGRGGASLQW